MSKNYSSKVISVAEAEVGYLEKASNFNLESKTANAGKNNYTKYANDFDKKYPDFYNYPKNGYAWCDVFVDWCFVKAFGESEARRLLNQPEKSCGAGCDWSVKYYQDAGRYYKYPEVGDQIFFKDSDGDPCHTGIVYKVDSNNVYTIEGNTSSSSGVVANGGSVNKKSYPIGYYKIHGYGRPSYDKETATTKKAAAKTSSAKVKVEDTYVGKYQKWLNKNFSSGLDVDGSYGSKTKRASVKALQKTLNKDYRSGLDVDGDFGSKTKYACTKANIKQGSKGNLVYILQGILYGLGYDPNGFDGKFGDGCAAAVKKYQKAKKLTADGIVGSNTWCSLLK